MKTAIILVGLSLIIGPSSVATSTPEKDGYTLYRNACEHHDSLELSNSPAYNELNDFLNNGGEPGDPLLDLLKQEQKAFTLISEAHKTRYWKLPDITTFSAETSMHYTTSWLGLNRVATTQAILLHRDGNHQDALSFLVPFNTTGQKVSKAGTLIQILVHTANRSMQYPVLTSSIDGLPEASLSEELIRAKEQYAQIPTVNEFMEGEQYMAINTSKNFFSELRAELKPKREKMIEGLKKAGVDDKTLKQIEESEVFTVADWEKQLLSYLERFQAFYRKAIATRPTSELSELDDELDERIEQIGSGVEYEAAMAALKQYMTNQTSGAFSISDAERIHTQVGKAISQQLLNLLMVSVDDIGTSYREFMAFERLLLIRLAVREYAHKHGKSPSTLQELVDNELLKKEMIVDPLSGKKFLTKKDGILEAYSVGEDLDDDNGVPWNKDTKSGDTILIPLEKEWGDQEE